MTLTDTPASGFTPGQVRCWTIAGAQLPMTGMSFQLPAGQQAVCTIEGAYANPNAATDASNKIQVAAHDPQDNSANGMKLVSATVDPVKVLPPDLQISKSIVGATQISAGSTVTYKVVITNPGPSVVIGPTFELIDKLNLIAGSSALQAQLQGTPSCVATGGADCLDVNPSNGTNPVNIGSNYPTVFQVWTFGSSPGLMPANSTITLTYTVKVTAPNAACTNGTDGLHNAAFFDLQRLPGTGVTEANGGNNTAQSADLSVNTGITTTCGGGTGTSHTKLVTLDKIQMSPTGNAPWSGQVVYKIVIKNNSTTATVTQLKLSDILFQLSGTPNFQVTNVSTSCVNSGSGGACNGSLLGPVQLTGWNSSASVWSNVASTSPPSLGPQDTITIVMTLRYDLTSCATASAPVIRNRITANWLEPGYGLDSSWKDVDTPMASAPDCNFKVTKTVDANQTSRIHFNTQYNYTVTYENLANNTVTVGTVSDFVRIMQANYATTLPFQYQFDCADGGTGVTGHLPTNSLGSTPNTGVIHYQTNSINGAAVIRQTGPVTFAGHSKLVCHVHLTVMRPADSDPNCSNTGELQNTALMDPWYFYNVNSGVPADPTRSAEVHTPLPRCFNLVVNKTADVLGTSTTGPGINYTLSVVNNGDPIVGLGPTTAWPVLTDSFAPSYVPTSITASPTAGTSTYEWIPGGSTPSLANPFSFGIHNLATGGVIQLAFPVPPPFQPGHVQNNASVLMSGPEAVDWYAKNPNTLLSNMDLPVTQATSTFTVLKRIINDTGKPTPQGSYLVKVDCSPNGPHTVVTLTPPNGLTQVLTIPQDSTCTIQETKAPPPPAGCRWEVTYPKGATGEDEAKLVVQNELKCDCPPDSSIKVTKKVVNETKYPTPNTPFEVKFDCVPNGPHLVVTLNAPNNLEQAFNVPVGSVCKISEIAPPPPPKPCRWETTYPNGSEGVPGVALVVVNTLKCDEFGKLNVVKKIVTPPGMPIPAGPYVVKLDCLPSGPHTSIVLTSPGGLSQSVNVPLNSSCVIGELPPPPPPPGCYWQISYPSGTAGHAGSSLAVVNTLKCDKVGEITLAKKIVTPPGMPDPAGPYNIKLDCNPTGPHVVVPLSSPINLTRAIGIPAGSTCTIVELTPPAPIGCFWSTSYPAGTTGGPGSTLAVLNTLICKPHFDILTVTKRVIVPPGMPAPVGPFQVKVDCNPNGPHTTVVLTGPSNLSKAVVVAAGSTSCTITELPPPPPPEGCAWSVTYPAGQGGHPTSTLIAQNTLVCKEKPGQLDVIKKVTSDGPIPPPATNFLVDVNCQPGGPTTTVTLNSGNGFHVLLSPIAAGRVCAIHEQAPPVPPALARRGCRWETSYPFEEKTGISVGEAARLVVENRWICKGDDEKTGSLTVYKKIDNQSPIPPPSTTFLVDVNCQPGGPVTTVTLNAADNYQATINAIVAGRTCLITERAPPVPPELARRGCHWTTQYPDGNKAGIEPGGRAELGVVNVWSCKGGGDGDKTGSLTVYKKIDNQSPIPPPSTTFLVDVNCQPGGPTTTLTLNSADNYQATINAIAAGRTCLITERAPPVPPDLARRGCHWTTQYPGGTKAGIEPAGRAELGVVNVWSCKGGGDGDEKPGSLTIFKKVENASPIPPPATNFLVDVNCQPGGPATTVTLNAGNGYQGAVNPIPAGRNCAITEQAPPVPANYARMGCRWTTTYPAGQHAAIGVGTAAQLTVTNRWTCNDKPSPGSITGEPRLRGNPRTDVKPVPDGANPAAGPADAATPQGPATKTEEPRKKARVSIGFGGVGPVGPTEARPARRGGEDPRRTDPGPGPTPRTSDGRDPGAGAPPLAANDDRTARRA